MQLAAVVYDGRVKRRDTLANTLEIYDYLLQRGAHVDATNATRRRVWKDDVIHRTGSTSRIPLSSEEDRAMATFSVYGKFIEVSKCRFLRLANRQTCMHTIPRTPSVHE